MPEAMLPRKRGAQQANAMTEKQEGKVIHVSING
jgi:hypothetical protein